MVRRVVTFVHSLSGLGAFNLSVGKWKSAQNRQKESRRRTLVRRVVTFVHSLSGLGAFNLSYCRRMDLIASISSSVTPQDFK